jgi:Raf kinase inhibitor-like YbhB/YbcL family protein
MIILRSNDFEEGEKIPKKYTCDGMNISPPLRWDTLPEHTISFAILCEDPDAAGEPFTHWIIYNIPTNVMELPTEVENKEKLENGAIQGINSNGYVGYTGPCPPKGPAHRYFFRIYALDKTLNLSPPVKRKNFLKALNENILDEGQLMAKYSR